MELNDGHPTWILGDVLGELPGDVGLPGARRAVEDDLALVSQQLDCVFEPRLV